MLAMIAYMMAAVSALAAAAFGLAILLGGSAQIGKEAAIAADKALHAPAASAAPGAEVGAATPKITGTTAVAETKPPQPAAGQNRKAGKSPTSKRKKRNADTRGARRN